MLNHKMLKYKIFLTLYTVLLITLFFASFKYKIPNSILISVICLSVYVAFHNETVGISASSAFNLLRYKMNKRMFNVIQLILMFSIGISVFGLESYLKETRICSFPYFQMIILLVMEKLVADTVFAFFVKQPPKN